MAIDREHPPKKSPSQNPVDFFEGKKKGGADGRGSSYKAPDKLTSGTQREKIYGRKDLSK